jgi:hypothetical protein
MHPCILYEIFLMTTKLMKPHMQAAKPEPDINALKALRAPPPLLSPSENY